jgi:hypothetical protein
MATATSTVGFALSLPDSWFELDVRPATRDASIRALVERRTHEQPELWEHRSELVRILRRQARDAAEAGAVYCACFVIVVDDSVIPGSLTVSIIPPPPGGSAADAIAEELSVKEPQEDGGTWMSRSIVDLPDAGRAARAQGVTDVALPGGGWLRTILMQTFVPVDADRLLLVAGASPAIDLAEPLLELFDTVTASLALVHDS